MDVPGQITAYIAQQAVSISEEKQSFESVDSVDIFPWVHLLVNTKLEIFQAGLLYIPPDCHAE